MPIALSEIRAKFPMYENVPDEQLIIGLHRKFYSDIPFKAFNSAIVYDNKVDPTDGMSGVDKFRAGVGKALSDTAQGLGQMVGLSDRSDVAETRRLDAPLMKNGAARAGGFVGDVATTLPLAFVPGANTLKGASLIGALSGLARPSESTGETATNVGLGGVAGGGSVLAGRALAAGYQGLTGLVRPLTAKGQDQIAAEVLQASATNPQRAAASLATARPLVPGSMPTVGQVADDAGLAQLERTLLNNPETAGPLNARYATQVAARKKAVADVAGAPGYRDAIAQGRSTFASQDYADAFTKGIDPQAVEALAPKIEALMNRPSIKSAEMTARNLAAEKNVSIDSMGSLEGLDWLKKGLDNQISKASMPGSSVGKIKLQAMLDTKTDLMDVIETLSPAYKVANDNFSKMSKQINAMDVAADLQSRLYKNAEYGAGREMGSTYQAELSKAVNSVKKQTGMNMSLSDVMNTKDISALENVARDLARKEKGQNLGRAVGSPTVQNMLGQNLLNRVVGPLGMPQSFGSSVIAQTMARPYDFVMRSAQPKISATLSEALADPVKAQALLTAAKATPKTSAIASRLEKFLPVAGLLALPDGQ